MTSTANESSGNFNFMPSSSSQAQTGHSNMDNSRQTPPLPSHMNNFEMQMYQQTPMNSHHAWTMQMQSMLNSQNQDMFAPHGQYMGMMHHTPTAFHTPPNSSEGSCSSSGVSSADEESPAISSPNDVKDEICSGIGAVWSNNGIGGKLVADMDQKFDEVPGRLCLLSASTKYKVTLGEMCRRMNAPETLHTSLMNGILRKGKAKNNGTRLRRALEDKNIKLPSGRRKTAPTTGFTAFCEAEAVNLARDFCALTAREGGAETIAAEMASLRKTEEAKAELAAKWETVMQGLEEVRQIYAAIPSQPEDIKPKTSAEYAINKFSLLTHGFGHTAVLGSIDHIRRLGYHTIKACGQAPSIDMETTPSSHLPMPPLPHSIPMTMAEMHQHMSMMPTHPASFMPSMHLPPMYMPHPQQ